jgi:hypothetical protein
MSNNKWYVVNKRNLDSSGPYSAANAQKIADDLTQKTEDDWEVRGRVFPVDQFEPRD